MNEENNVLGTEQQGAADQTERSGAENKTPDVPEKGVAKTFTQEEVDKIVEKRLKRERQKFADVLNQGDPREAAMAERERAVTAKELRMEATETFMKEHLPADMLDLLNYTDKESCDQSIELVRRVFAANVHAEVDRRLMGGKPIKKAPPTDADSALRGAFGL